jgi:FixJ family two-component response regulator
MMAPTTSIAEHIVFIVDDDQAVLDSLSMLMKSENLPCMTFRTAENFLDYYDESKLGCLILDVGMPGMSGLQLQQRLKRLQTLLPIIFITGHGDVPMAVRAIQEGASDFIQKPFGNAELLSRVHQVLAAMSFRQQPQQELQPAQFGHKSLIKHQGGGELLQTLTKREREVLNCVVEGLPNKRTADRLNISQRTVEVHRANLMHKLQANSTAELVRLILEYGQKH